MWGVADGVFNTSWKSLKGVGGRLVQFPYITQCRFSTPTVLVQGFGIKALLYWLDNRSVSMHALFLYTLVC